jgi:hypothetical protein
LNENLNEYVPLNLNDIEWKSDELNSVIDCWGNDDSEDETWINKQIDKYSIRIKNKEKKKIRDPYITGATKKPTWMISMIQMDHLQKLQLIPPN